MSLQKAMVLINGHEYERAIIMLKEEASNESRSPSERAEFCEWLAECYRKLEDYKESGNWYLEAVKRIFSIQQVGVNVRARRALPLSEKALECYKQGGGTVDVMTAAKLKQRLIDLSA
jgi:tetratricopeptide (TPR) repeat protein